MNLDPVDVQSSVQVRIGSGPARAAWTAADFSDLGTRDAVDKALQRLTRKGALRRIGRGLYDQPALNRLTGKPNPPSPRAVIDAVARRDKARMLVDGMTAANDLGLTDEVPAKIIVHTDARLMPIRLDQATITFKPTAASKLFWAGRPAMRVVQALRWRHDVAPFSRDEARLKSRVERILASPNEGEAMRADLRDGFSAMPAWMQDFLRPLLNDDVYTPAPRTSIQKSRDQKRAIGDNGLLAGRRRRDRANSGR